MKPNVLAFCVESQYEAVGAEYSAWKFAETANFCLSFRV